MDNLKMIWSSVCFLIILVCQIVQLRQLTRYRKEIDGLRKKLLDANFKFKDANIEFYYDIKELKSDSKWYAGRLERIESNSSRYATWKEISSLYKIVENVKDKQSHQDEFNKSFVKGIRRLTPKRGSNGR